MDSQNEEQMISFDVSKLLHPRFWDLVPAFMPGFFFEISIFLAQPDMVRTLIGPAQMERYLEIIIAIFLAFIIGNAFMLWVRVIQTNVRLMDKLAMSLRHRFSECLVRVLRKWGLGASRFVRWVMMRGMIQREKFSAAHMIWRKAAAQVLQRRYGIQPPGPLQQPEWLAWSSVLGRVRPDWIRGVLLITATEATGWAGLAAAYVVPCLRIRPYLVFSIFLVFYGLISDWVNLRRWNRPAPSWLAGTRATLLEIPNAPAVRGLGTDEDVQAEDEVHL